MAKPLLALVLTASFLTAAAPTVAHAQRLVVVNGRIVTPQSLAALDRAACLQVPNGSYWLDTNTGIWGDAGNPARKGTSPTAAVRRGARASRSAACSTARMTG